MNVEFEFPAKVQQFLTQNGISEQSIEQKIYPLLGEDLRTEDNQPIICDQIRVVVVGIHTEKGKIDINPIEISEEKPMKMVSRQMTNPDYYLFYLIFDIS